MTFYLRDFRGDREVGALGLESVLVGDVLEGDGGAVGGGVLEGALGLQRGVVRALCALQVALLLGGDAVVGLKAGNKKKNVNRI